MTSFYNEIDPVAAQTLRNLIDAGHIAPGVVDERSIEDVRPDELVGYTQCHFFAGIGIWSHALRQAGWPDDRPVWTGSCPCQPFSAAGKGDGFADERHLWPAWFHLVAQRRPSDIFGEQVASKAAEPWIDLVQADLEGLGYSFGSVPFPAAGVGAPHIRDRNYWFAGVSMGDAISKGLEGHGRHGNHRHQPGWVGTLAARSVAAAGGIGRLADMHGHGRESRSQGFAATRHGPTAESDCGAGGLEHAAGRGCGEFGHAPLARSSGHADGTGDGAGGLGHADGERQSAERGVQRGPQSKSPRRGESGRLADAYGGNAGAEREQRGREQRFVASDDGFVSIRPAGPVNGHWADVDWLFCRDGKWRPVSPKPQPLVDGSSESLGRVLPETIQKIEEEVNAWSMESGIDSGKAMRDVLLHLGAQAKQCWPPGGIPRLHEAPFLLAFLRQLAQQGWGVAQRLPISCEEVAQECLRSLPSDEQPASTSCEHRLEGQQPGERADAVSFLSSLLARHALAAWDGAYAAHAEIGFPLVVGARSRTSRLRAYGNGICATQAQAFIESVMEAA